MQYSDNESSSDSDISTRNQQESNPSEPVSAEETASGVTSPRKSLPEQVGLNLMRLPTESIRRTTSLSSQCSDTILPSQPGDGTQPHARRMSLKLTDISPSGSGNRQRVTRSSRRTDRGYTQESVLDCLEPDVPPAGKPRSRREKKRRGGSERRSDIEVSLSPVLGQESDNDPSGVEEEFSSTPSLPLALVVSIPIENSSSTPGFVSDATSDTEVSNQMTPPSRGKYLEGRGDSTEENPSSSSEERSTPSYSSQGEGEMPESSGVREFDSHSSSTGGASDTGDEGEGLGTRDQAQKLRASSKISENFKTDKKSGKSIPDTKKGNRENQKDAVNIVSRKRVVKRSKKGKKKDENTRHVLELDRKLNGGEGGREEMEKWQWESYHLLRSRDQQAIFCAPVTDDIAPGYSALISQPMDFSQMRDKIETSVYTCLQQLSEDFMLMCQNAMTYNKPATYYYKAAKKIRESGIKLLDKMARDALSSRDHGQKHPSRDSASTLQGEPRVRGGDKLGPLVVSIERSLLPSFQSPKSTVLTSPSRTSLLQDSVTHETSKPNTNTTTNGTCDSNTELPNSSPPLNKSVVERQTSDGHTAPDTTLLPLPSSYAHSFPTQKTSHATENRAVEPPIQPVAKPVPAKQPTACRSAVASKGPVKSLEIKQKKLKRRREMNRQKQHHSATQAKMIYRGSLAPIRPLNYGSFSSFAPTYDSSFANINSEETDRLYSILEHRDVRDVDDSMLCSSYNSEVSPYYLRLGEGILNMNKELDGSSSLQKREREATIPPELIRMQILRQQAFQNEMRRRMEEGHEAPSHGRAYQQQLDDMLQQSALLITSLSQRQEQEQEQEDQGPVLGEELDKISKILSAIGGNLNLDEMPT